MESLKDRISAARNRLKSVDTIVITPDGREFVERRNSAGDRIAHQKGVRPWGFVGDLKPDLQMAEVYPSVFLGSQDPAADAELLQSHRVTHIINLATGVDDHFPKTFHYLRLQILDLPESDLLTHFEECFKFIEESVSHPPHTVFVHCNAGVSRSATVCIAYIMHKDNIGLVDAFNRVKAIRKCVNPNLGFMQQLQKFERLQCAKNQITV